jgi:hypothetical protein
LIDSVRKCTTRRDRRKKRNFSCITREVNRTSD